MGKLLFWAVIIIGGLLLARVLAHHNARQAAGPRTRKPASNMAAKSPETMVRCEHCQVHLPMSEAVMRDGRYWCSVEHSKLGTRE